MKASPSSYYKWIAKAGVGPVKILYVLPIILVAGGVVAALSVNAKLDNTKKTNSTTSTPTHPSEVLFNGMDAQGTSQLWITNGTASGTTRLTGRSGVTNNNGANEGNVNPTEITPFDNKAAFAGDGVLGVTDGTSKGTQLIEPTSLGGNTPIAPAAIARFGNKALVGDSAVGRLWITDGTNTGTTLIKSFPYTSAPEGFTTIGSKGDQAVFNFWGQLWVTNGTTRGTKQVTNLPNTANDSLHPTDITAFDHEALFEGTDASASETFTGRTELWVTNGTTSGTKELTNITNDYGGLNPKNITIFGNKVLFSGNDATGEVQLWVTNGTAGGTTEITKPGLENPTNITVVGNEALFSSVGELWVTNGTTGGTYQISDNIHVPQLTNEPADTTALGNTKALFQADTIISGHPTIHGYPSLWSTNGTAAGTSMVADSFNGNVFADTITDITAFGNNALFNVNAAQLWVTNGTAGGTQELKNIVNADSSGINPTDMTVLSAPPATAPAPAPKNPCPRDFPAECLIASNAAYKLDTDSLNDSNVPDGMKILMESDLSERKVGFDAVALKDSKGNVIIANEGSLQFAGSTATFVAASGTADAKIAKNNLSVPALKDAVAFTQQVINNMGKYGGTSKIYVTGHSLGGIEAEAEAKAFPARISGGATFGATGLPGNTSPGGPEGLVNYVDYGDPIGNYASDPVNALSDHTADIMYHYGQVKMVGSRANVSDLQNAVIRREASLALPPAVPGPADVPGADPIADYFFLSMLYNLASSVPYHLIAHYASDLSIDKIAPLGQASIGELMLIYDEQLGGLGIQNIEATNVQNNGTLDSPDAVMSYNAKTKQATLDENSSVQEPWGTISKGGIMIMSFDPSTGRTASIRYVSPDKSVYYTTLNSSEEPTTIQVNPNTGGSYQIDYDTTNTQQWSDYTDYYTGKNETETLTERVTNLRSGESQVEIFTESPRVQQNYSGLNGTGKLLSTTSAQYD